MGREWYLWLAVRNTSRDRLLLSSWQGAIRNHCVWMQPRRDGPLTAIVIHSLPQFLTQHSFIMSKRTTQFTNWISTSSWTEAKRCQDRSQVSLTIAKHQTALLTLFRAINLSKKNSNKYISFTYTKYNFTFLTLRRRQDLWIFWAFNEIHRELLLHVQPPGQLAKAGQSWHQGLGQLGIPSWAIAWHEI